MRRKTRFHGTIITAIGFFAGICFWVLPSFGAEPKPGDVIDSTNIDQYADYFAPFMARFIKDGWGFEKPVVIHVREPLGEYPMPPRYKEASKKNVGTVKLNPDGTLSGYVSGLPFPNIDPKEPDASEKIMWNYYYRCKGDSSGYAPNGNYPAGYKYYERRKGGTVTARMGDIRYLFFSSRTDVQPIPELQNPHKLYSAQTLLSVTPPMKDMISLLWRYKDPTKTDEMWVYLPELRRSLRLMSSEKSNPIRASCGTWDELYGWDGQMGQFSYELVREQKILQLMQAKTLWTELPNQMYKHPVFFSPDDPNEMVDTYVIKITPKDPGYPSSKFLLWVAKDIFSALDTQNYDKAGELWKVQNMAYAQYTTIQGKKITAIHDNTICDLKTQFWGIAVSGKRIFNTEWKIGDFMAGTYFVNY